MSSKNPRLSLNGEAEGPTFQPDHRQKQVVEALDKRFKELNKIWEKAEASLRQIPIPVDVHCHYKSVSVDPPDEPRGEAIHHYLGFVKSKGGWRICHGSLANWLEENDYDWKPITECSLDLRLEAIPHLEKLRELVLKAAEESVPKLDEAIAALRSITQSW